jgi:hypothetical protein
LRLSASTWYGDGFIFDGGAWKLGTRQILLRGELQMVCKKEKKNVNTLGKQDLVSWQRYPRSLLFVVEEFISRD